MRGKRYWGCPALDRWSGRASEEVTCELRPELSRNEPRGPGGGEFLAGGSVRAKVPCGEQVSMVCHSKEVTYPRPSIRRWQRWGWTGAC